jgi:nitroreductase
MAVSLQVISEKIAKDFLQGLPSAASRRPAPILRASQATAYDLGQATTNIMLAATDLGIGSGHAAASDQEQARRVLGFPNGYFCAYLIGLGYPADRWLRPLVRPDRRPFDEVVYWDRW